MGARPMRRMICDRFVWSEMARDILRWARTCVACQRAKVSRHIVAPLMPLLLPAKGFDSIHVDLSCRYTVRCNRVDIAVSVSWYNDIEP